MSIGLARLASRGRSVASATRVSSDERRQLEAGCATGVGTEDAEPACVRQHSDAPAARRRLPGEEHRGVRELLERVRLDHARLPEERLDRGRRSGERGGMGSGRALPDRRPPALHRQNRLLPRDAAGEARKLARVPERLQVEQDQVGLRIVLPVLEQVVRRDVSLVADRDEGRQPQAARRSLLQHGEPERAALGREADVAGREVVGREGCVQPRLGGEDAEAVRSDQPRSVRSNSREELLLQPGSVGAGLGETGGDHAERARALAHRSLGLAEHGVTGHAEDGEVDASRECPRSTHTPSRRPPTARSG